MSKNSFGQVKSQAGSGKTYDLVFVQDGKIITPNAVLDASALKAACAAKGGNPASKFVQVRLTESGDFHAQLPDESANRIYGTAFDFVDPALKAALYATVETEPAPTAGYGTVKSQAGTKKTYTLVFVQDGKIVTPGKVLDAAALKATMPSGTIPQSKFVQVRVREGNTIHAQLPDESVNRPYGSAWDFEDKALAELLTSA